MQVYNYHKNFSKTHYKVLKKATITQTNYTQLLNIQKTNLKKSKNYRKLLFQQSLILQTACHVTHISDKLYSSKQFVNYVKSIENKLPVDCQTLKIGIKSTKKITVKYSSSFYNYCTGNPINV